MRLLLLLLLLLRCVRRARWSRRCFSRAGSGRPTAALGCFVWREWTAGDGSGCVCEWLLRECVSVCSCACWCVGRLVAGCWLSVFSSVFAMTSGGDEASQTEKERKAKAKKPREEKEERGATGREEGAVRVS